MKVKRWSWPDIFEMMTFMSVILSILTILESAVVDRPSLKVQILLVFSSFIFSLITEFFRRRYRRYKVIETNGKTIRICCGNLFDASDNIIIPVNRTFDTKVDDIIISSKSLHGMFITKYFNNTNSLREQIERQLQSEPFVEITRNGDVLKEYGPGTMVSIITQNKRFILLALTQFDCYNNAYCLLSDYCATIDRLLREFNKKGQGSSISIPLIGGGLSRMKTEPETLLELLVSLIKIHKDDYPKEITIILRKETMEDIDLSKVN